ncbi:MAG: threonine--tRNA ligase, partial [Chloroflexi bacterium]|nr:threonine--tRNA ligase [Chloroflexota bacterium]
LLSIAGAYWRGKEDRPMLQRIYGAAFFTQKELDAHLKWLEEVARRDHRRLGRELDLFSTHEEAGPGMIYWHPKGARIRGIIEDLWRAEHYRRDYSLVVTPHVGKSWLWETSGHLGFYKENMFDAMDMDGLDYYIKPMNCPFHIMIYRNALRSYRELPLRFGELGTVYRFERAGVLHGLMRVRGFTQDDAHIFCRPDQVEDEVVGVLDMMQYFLSLFGFNDVEVFVSTKPEKAVGRDEDWDMATQALQRAVDRVGWSYKIDAGGGAFYGPKVDVKIKDALGRTWQCSTVQFDFNEPERFGLEYIGADGQPHRPVMVHRAILGSMERFFGVLGEHFGGAFPVWLAPVQATVIPIADRHIEYAQQVMRTLKGADIRAEVDARSERMNYKIREAQTQKVPYMLVVGDNEAAAGTVSVRLRSGENLGALSLDDVQARIAEEVKQRS